MLLTEAAVSLTPSGTSITSVFQGINEVINVLFNTASHVLGWLVSEPICLIAVLMGIIGMAIGLIRKFTVY